MSFWVDICQKKHTLRDHSGYRDLSNRSGERAGIVVDYDPRRGMTWSADTYKEGGFWLPAGDLEKDSNAQFKFGGAFYAAMGEVEEDKFFPYRDAGLVLDKRYKGTPVEMADDRYPICTPGNATTGRRPIPGKPPIPMMVDPALHPVRARGIGRPLPEGSSALMMAGTEELGQSMITTGLWDGLLVADTATGKYSTAIVDIDGKDLDAGAVAGFDTLAHVAHLQNGLCAAALSWGSPKNGGGNGLFKQRSGLYGYACFSRGGPIGAGAGAGDKHHQFTGAKGDHFVTGHVMLSAPWYVNSTADGPPDFDRIPYQSAGNLGILNETFFRFHTLGGVFKWQTPVPNYIYEPDPTWRQPDGGTITPPPKPKPKPDPNPEPDPDPDPVPKPVWRDPAEGFFDPVGPPPVGSLPDGTPPPGSSDPEKPDPTGSPDGLSEPDTSQPTEPGVGAPADPPDPTGEPDTPDQPEEADNPDELGDSGSYDGSGFEGMSEEEMQDLVDKLIDDADDWLEEVTGTRPPSSGPSQRPPSVADPDRPPIPPEVRGLSPEQKADLQGRLGEAGWTWPGLWSGDLDSFAENSGGVFVEPKTPNPDIEEEEDISEVERVRPYPFVHSWLESSAQATTGRAFDVNSEESEDLRANTSPGQETLDAQLAKTPVSYAMSFTGAWDRSDECGWEYTQSPANDEKNHAGGTSRGVGYVHSPETSIEDFENVTAAADITVEQSQTGIGMQPEVAWLSWGYPVFEGDNSGLLAGGFQIGQGTSGGFDLKEGDSDGNYCPMFSVGTGEGRAVVNVYDAQTTVEYRGSSSNGTTCVPTDSIATDVLRTDSAHGYLSSAYAEAGRAEWVVDATAAEIGVDYQVVTQDKTGSEKTWSLKANGDQYSPAKVRLNADGTAIVLDGSAGATSVKTASFPNVTGTVVVLDQVSGVTADPGPAEYWHRYLCDSVAAAFNFTLPTAAGNIGAQIIVKDHTGNSGTNAITFNTTGGETIDGNASGVVTMTSAYSIMTFTSDGTNWMIGG